MGGARRCKVYQFMKVPSARFGEHRMFEQIGLPIEGLGDGFSWKSQDLEHSAQLARDGWQPRRAPTILAWRALPGGAGRDHLPADLRLAAAAGRAGHAARARPTHVHVCLTGRRCPPEIIELADTVTEMTKIKHAFNAGVPAQRGIED
jgi:cob(I)alamin adenosyltransferase